MKKNNVKRYWSPVWGKVVDGVCFMMKSEMGGGMVVTGDERVMRIIEGSKAFRKGRVKLMEEVCPAAERQGTVARDPEAELRGTVAEEACCTRREDVVSFQMAKEIVMKAMDEAGEEVKTMKSKVEVKAEAARLGIEFPNLK